MSKGFSYFGPRFNVSFQLRLLKNTKKMKEEDMTDVYRYSEVSAIIVSIGA